ncbi:MAG: rhomboid family intramembrane serine protease [Flavobacteriaceae bacterium]|nr:MAG: rhomboid family intramembrane serine protease [Flavobacteriaceae bacterium]
MISLPRITKALLLLNGLFFVLTGLLEMENIQRIFSGYYPLSPLFRPEQILTHMFLHGGTTHFFFNMFSLWMFGSTVERQLGEKKFTILYFVAGLGSYFLFNFVNYFEILSLEKNLVAMGLNPQSIIQNAENVLDIQGRISSLPQNQVPLAVEYARHFISPMLGASGAIYGLLVVFGLLNPNSELMLMFFPFPIKAKYFIPLLLLWDFLAGIRDSATDNTAHFAHIGGAIFGLILGLYWYRINLSRIYKNH